MLRCELAVVSPRQPSLRPQCSKSPLRGEVLATLFSISTSPEEQGTISAGLPINFECTVTATRRPWNDRLASHLSDSGILLTFACLHRQSLLGDDHCLRRRVQHANKHSGNRGSHFPPLAGLAGMYRIFFPNARKGVLSFRPCSLCSGVFPLLSMLYLNIKYAANSTSQHSILASGVPIRCSSADSSVLAWPATSPTARSMDDPIGLAFSHWWSLWNGLVSFLASLCDFPRQCLNRRLVVAPERDSVVPEVVDELRYSLCDPGELRSFSRKPTLPTSSCVSVHG